MALFRRVKPPFGIKNLQSLISQSNGAWFSASDIGSMRKDTGGSEPVTTINQSVGKWLDLSGLGNHATAISGSESPILRQDSNGALYLEFDGSNDGFTYSLPYSGTSRTVIAICNLRDTASDCIIASGVPSFGGTTTSWQLSRANTSPKSLQLALCRPTNVYNIGNNINNQLTGIELITAMYDTTASGYQNQIACRVDGNGVPLTKFSSYGSSMNGVSLDSGTNTIGRNSAGVSYPAKMNLYGMLVFCGLPDNYVLGKIERYIRKEMLKCSITYSQGLILGDSTIASYLGMNEVKQYLPNPTWHNSIAVPGNTIAQQKTAYESCAYKTTATWVVVQVGLNDLDPAESATTALGRLQGLIDTINASKNSSCSVFIATMTPLRQRLINVYGPTNGPIAYQKWLDMNDAIAGNGANAITGVSGRITSHSYALNDGYGNLAAAYDTGDGVHENNSGRAVIAGAWTDALRVNGISS